MQQGDLEFLIPADNDTYIDPDIKLYVRVKLVSGLGLDLDEKYFTDVTNNFLHSLFNLCNIEINRVPITQSGDLYQYRSYLETLWNYGNYAATSYHTNSFWYLDNGDMFTVTLRQRIGPLLQRTWNSLLVGIKQRRVRISSFRSIT